MPGKHRAHPPRGAPRATIPNIPSMVAPGPASIQAEPAVESNASGAKWLGRSQRKRQAGGNLGEPPVPAYLVRLIKNRESDFLQPKISMTWWLQLTNAPM